MSSIVQCPFLYQTRTLLRHKVGVQRVWQRSLASMPESSTIKTDSDPLQTDKGDARPSFLQQKAREVVAKQSRTKPSSMLDQQGQVSFDDIWKHFETTTPTISLLPTPQGDTTMTARDHTVTDYQAILQLFSIGPERNQNQESHQDATQTDHRPLGTTTPSSTSTPSSLRTANSAATAEIAGHLSNQAKPTTTIHQTDLATQTAQSILSDISASFHTVLKSSPNPDQTIWTISSKKIFPLIKLLTPPRPSLSTSQPSTPKPPTQPQSHPLIPPSLPLLPLLTILYPSTLLLLLRTLTASTPGSPYIPTLLPYIKSLGPTSYVLGINTHFYNCLLRSRWDIYSDFRSIDSLLSEMERNGVEFDAGTMDVLRAVGEDRRLGERGKERVVDMEKRKGKAGRKGVEVYYGSRGRDWWGRREVQKGLDRIEEWKRVVGGKLEGREMGMGMGTGTGEVMREGGELDQEGQGEEDYVVTL